MSNERIDTSKYDGHTKGPWWTGEWFTDGFSTFEKGYCVEQRIVTEPPFVDEVGEWICLVDNEADAKLIADAPEILAELKRCYEQLDAVKHEVENCSECGGHREEEGLFHYCQNYCRCEEFDAS